MIWNNTGSSTDGHMGITDFGAEPFTVNINTTAKRNRNYRTALWTGHYLQLTLMSMPVGGEIGLEVHPDTDRYIRIESGIGFVQMGERKETLNYQNQVGENDVVFVPAGTWHNITNTGRWPLKVSTIYAPPHHPHGTIHQTKADADAEENHY